MRSKLKFKQKLVLHSLHLSNIGVISIRVRSWIEYLRILYISSCPVEAGCTASRAQSHEVSLMGVPASGLLRNPSPGYRQVRPRRRRCLGTSPLHSLTPPIWGRALSRVLCIRFVDLVDLRATSSECLIHNETDSPRGPHTTRYIEQHTFFYTCF